MICLHHHSPSQTTRSKIANNITADHQFYLRSWPCGSSPTFYYPKKTHKPAQWHVKHNCITTINQVEQPATHHPKEQYQTQQQILFQLTIKTQWQLHRLREDKGQTDKSAKHVKHDYIAFNQVEQSDHGECDCKWYKNQTGKPVLELTISTDWQLVSAHK